MNRRSIIKLTDNEISDYLNLSNSMTLGTINSDGTVNLVAMWYGFFNDGSLGMWTFSKSQKAVNLRRDPRVTCLVESGTTYDSLIGVEIKGIAELSEDKESLIEIGSSIYVRYFGELDENGRRSVETMSNKRISIRLLVDKIISWDHSKLAGKY